MPAEDVLLLLYDNHHNQSSPVKRTELLYRSAKTLGVPYHVGHLIPATERSWLAGDREEWLLRVLPSVSANMVVLLDASDAVLFCRAAELVAK